MPLATSLIVQYGSDKKTKSQQNQQIIIQQKTKELFWRGFGGRNRPSIGGLGDSPPNLAHCLIGKQKLRNHISLP
ncbi:hypothetical protein IQ244_30320 [Nostoc sp. LEGE 06077]|nr:hypothetical protein [Nostoc sp. LEGE 06077]